MKYILICLYFLLISVLGKSQTLEISLDTSNILIGQQSTLLIKASVEAKDTVIWPSFNDTISSEIEILETSKIDTSYDDQNIGIKYYKQYLTITSFDSGHHVIKPVSITLNDSLLISNAELLNVFTQEVDTSKGIVDIFEPIQVPFSFKEWLKDNWILIAIIVALIITIIVLIRYLKRRKLKPAVLPPSKPSLPAHIIAKKELDTLVKKKLWEKGKYKAFYTELSDIMRSYLENRYNILALEETTHEIKIQLKNIIKQDELYQSFIGMLELSDLVKFAKETPIEEENKLSLNTSYKFIEVTKKVAKELPKEEEENE